MNKELYIQGIFNEYMGLRDQALADLQVYIDSPQGIGDHPDLGSMIKLKIEQVDKFNSLIETMKKHFASNADEPKTDQAS